MGEMAVGAQRIDELLADWEQRDRSFDSPKRYDILCKIYGIKWSFFGDEKAIHLAVRLSRLVSAFSGLRSDIHS